jgi:hypothetical protein
MDCSCLVRDCSLGWLPAIRLAADSSPHCTTFSLSPSIFSICCCRPSHSFVVRSPFFSLPDRRAIEVTINLLHCLLGWLGLAAPAGFGPQSMVLLWVQAAAICTLQIVFICAFVNILTADTYFSPVPDIEMAKQATAAAPQQLMFPGNC